MVGAACSSLSFTGYTVCVLSAEDGFVLCWTLVSCGMGQGEGQRAPVGTDGIYPDSTPISVRYRCGVCRDWPLDSGLFFNFFL